MGAFLKTLARLFVAKKVSESVRGHTTPRTTTTTTKNADDDDTFIEVRRRRGRWSASEHGVVWGFLALLLALGLLIWNFGGPTGQAMLLSLGDIFSHTFTGFFHFLGQLFARPFAALSGAGPAISMILHGIVDLAQAIWVVVLIVGLLLAMSMHFAFPGQIRPRYLSSRFWLGVVFVVTIIALLGIFIV